MCMHGVDLEEHGWIDCTRGGIWLQLDAVSVTRISDRFGVTIVCIACIDT